MMKTLLIAIICSLSLLTSGRAEENKTKTTLENDLYRVDVDSETGVICKIFDKTGGIDLITEPRLADNFRLLIPLPDLEGNYLNGKEQRLASIDKEPNSLLLHWTAPLTTSRGPLDVRVTM